MKRNRKKKRTTFARLFTRNAVIGLFVTAVFAGILFSEGTQYIWSQARNELYYRMQGTIEEAQKEDYSDEKLTYSLRVSANFGIALPPDPNRFQIVPDITENCTALIAILDENGDICYSSRRGLSSLILLSEDKRGFMLCNTEVLDIPEVTELEEAYYAMLGKETMFTDVQFHMSSAYVNAETNSFIPHEAVLNLVQYDPKAYEKKEIIETKPYTITLPRMEGYELVKFDAAEESYPRAYICSFSGTNRDHFDELMQEMERVKTQCSPSSGGFYGSGITSKIWYDISYAYLDGSRKTILVAYKIDAWNSVTKPLYFGIVAVFMMAVLLIAFLDSWRRNVKYQAAYAFEDYQRALTNDLAHDLKTPLMAIGGYAENLIEGKLSEEERKRYLQSILDNVAYTDSIITRTLELNNMQQIEDVKKEKLNVRMMVERIVEKYSLMLEERNITVETDGQAEITANLGLFETAIENLISNAVKYTPENGHIQIRISPKCCKISNTVNGKVDTSDLKRPFTKGDEARGGKCGSGLGLSIAEKAAGANHFKLVLSCSDTEYTAELDIH